MIGRSSGRSAIAAAAYRSGTHLRNEETGLVHDFSKRKDVVYTNVLLPGHAPSDFQQRENLWHAVQVIEKGSRAQLCREVELALPKELGLAEQIACVEQYVQSNFIEKGMCADVALHDKGDGNPHAHILLTTRSLKKDGTWAPKARKKYVLDENGDRIYQGKDKSGRRQFKSVKEDYNDWNKKETLEQWRSSWAETCNTYLSPDKHIDHRSLSEQGLERIPMIHEGYVARQMEQRGQKAERCEINREITDTNGIIESLKIILKEIWLQLKKLYEERKHERSRRTNPARAGESTLGGTEGRTPREGAARGEKPSLGEGESNDFFRKLKDEISDSRTAEKNIRADEDNSGTDRQNREVERERQSVARKQKDAERDRERKSQSTRNKTRSHGYER